MPVPEWQNADQQDYEREILASRRLAELRGVACGWPLVQKGLESGSSAMSHLQMQSRGTGVE